MKKYLIVLSALTIVTVSVNAQTKRSTDETTTAHHYQKDGKRHGHANGMMMKDLNLSDAQKQQAKSLRDEYKTQHTQLDANKASMSQEDYKAKKMALRSEQKSKFESILTADQKSKMADMKSQQMAKRSEMGEKRMDKMKTNLKLTDDQVAKLKSQHESFASEAKSIRDNTSLTEEQKKQSIMDLRKRSQEDQKSILTAEQLQKKEEMKSKRTHDWKNKSSEKS
ncbi:MAG: hypothetical protein ABI683_05450 [Ginsengibacter sp.]